jgi:preprotein translocase subunit Sec61beta
MAKQKKGEGFHSSAGLIRYFDAEEKSSLRIPPWFVIVMCISTILILTIANIMFKL